MNEWTSSPVSKLAEITSGGTPSRTIDEFWDGHIPWVTPTDITSCRTNYLHDTKEKITAKGLAASSATLLPKGALLFTSRATIGEMKIAVNPVATNQGFKSLSPKPGVDGLFLFYQVCRLKSEFIRFGAGSTFPEINRKDTARVEIPHPVNPTVQKKIAKILQTVDETIEQTEALIEKYSLVKAGMMHDLFTRGLTPDGKLRPPREEAPDLYKNTPIGWIPTEWDAKTSSELLKSGILVGIQDGNHGEIHPKKSDFVNDGIPFIMASNISKGAIDYEAANKISRKQYESLRIGFSKPGDVLLSHKASIGFVAVVPPELEELMLTPQVTYYRPSDGIRSDYLADFLRSAKFQRPLKGLAQQSTRDYIGIQAQKALTIHYPLAQLEQAEISKRLGTLEQKISKNRDYLKKLLVQKSGLMRDLLTGEVTVKVDEPEAAHV